MATKFNQRTEKAKKAIVGKRFGRLLVTGYVAGARLPGLTRLKARAICSCDCGNSNIIDVQSLSAGTTRSCGCLRDEKVKERMTTHGMSDTDEYIAWENIKNRCYYEKDISYKNYGGRGITVCASWLDKEYGFLNFFRDIGKKPSKTHSIDRINNDDNYEPSNCRWATRKEQATNKRKASRCHVVIKRDDKGRFVKRISNNAN